MNIQAIIEAAIKKYGSETEVLLPYVERRYDRALFPSTGQYDWFSAQVLYCLLRWVQPEAIVEVSTSSGYSTLIQATALRKNGHGIIHTFELNPRLAAAAQGAFRHFGLDDVIQIYVGDARVEAGLLPQLPQPVLLFLDSLHTEAFARWFIERWVLAAPPETLFHVHDVMPPSARVRLGGRPPWSLADRLIEAGRDLGRLLLGKATTKALGMVQPPIFPSISPGDLPATNGVLYSEAVFINRVVRQMPPGTYAYLHELADQYPQLHPHRFDSQAIQRQDRQGRPSEWNETAWLACGAFSQAMVDMEGCETADR